MPESRHASRGGSGGRGRGRSYGSSRGGRSSRPLGPQLPATLRSEMDSQSGATSRHSRGRGRDPDVNEPFKRRDAPNSSRQDRPEVENVPRQLKAKRSAEPLETTPARKKRKALALPGSKDEDAEDGEIEWLEYMLRKEKAKGEELDDGLDDLLDLADLVGPGGAGLQPDDSSDVQSEASDDQSDGANSIMDGVDLDDDDGASSSDEDDGGVENEGLAHIEEMESSDGEQLGLEVVTAEQQPNAEAAEESAPSRYVPPHLRASRLEEKARGDAARQGEKLKLERKSQGLLNKLSESNLETILGEIEGLYRDHSRNDVTTTLTDLVLQMISDRINLLDSFVVLYATLIGALYRVIGTEFGAHFIHSVITRYHDLPSDSDSSKVALNLVTLIAELYNAGVISARLIYDLVRRFLDSESTDGSIMGEEELEGLLKVLRISGTQLRSDDPASLKDIVGLVQAKTQGKESTLTARARFMIETLTNLKGGKSRSNANTDQDAVTRMKKFLSGLGRKRRVLALEPLRVSLSDLLTADTRGKWWLVGAGWSGNPLVEREVHRQKVVKEADEEGALHEAARRQGMNTDVRRTVFVILMSSEDYVHACDRLSQLKFTEVQQREFVRVALHCCMTETAYNPYHTLVLNNLCATSYSHRFTLQYALWDFLRELGDGEKPKKSRSSNVAKALAYIVSRETLDLTVFKAVEFTKLRSPSIYFFAVFLSRLMLGLQTSSPLFTLSKSFKQDQMDVARVEEAFEKTLSNMELAQGLMYIMGLKEGMARGLDSLDEMAVAVVTRSIKIARRVLSRAV